MANVAIYYQLNEHEESNNAIASITNIVKSTETYYTIVGVFVDSVNENIRLMDLFDMNLSTISKLIINKYPVDEFDQEMLYQLARSEKFQIELWN
ncbi:hypothetical protein [Guptibacillus sedimenti]|uniref:hypothetical protein n=1 Tax=Guptibacillus sedimenti TaxID=3025680 RepID=UPI00235F7061|nr:hypothetical protein [Pseudalkalibacillus sedimenti]